MHLGVREESRVWSRRCSLHFDLLDATLSNRVKGHKPVAPVMRILVFADVFMVGGMRALC